MQLSAAKASQSCYLSLLETDVANIIVEQLLPEACSVQQFRSRATSGRSVVCPHGNVGYGFVSVGNLLMVRTCMLLLLAGYRGARFLLEQPGSSCMAFMPRWDWLVDRMEVAWCALYMSLWQASPAVHIVVCACLN